MINLSNPEWIIAIGTIGGGIVGLLIWLVRLEGKLKQISKDVDRIDASYASLEKKSETIFEKIFDKLSTIEITLAKLEGKIDTNSTMKL